MSLQMLFQLVLASLVAAAPTITDLHSHNHGNNAWQYGAGGGVFGFIVLVLDIIVFIEVLKSDRLVSHKLAWCLLVFLFPIGGIIIYWLFSNRASHNRAGYEPIG